MSPSVESARFEVPTIPGSRRVRLIWSCPEPVRELTRDVGRFVDAAALAVPATPDAAWISMGAPGTATEGRCGGRMLRRRSSSAPRGWEP